MANNDAPQNYIDEKYEFLAPRFFDFLAGETPEETAEAERWFQISASYLPSPHVKTRSLLEAKKFPGLEDSYDEVRKLIARVSPKHGKTNISGPSDTISRVDTSGDAQISPELREETVGTAIACPLDSSTISNVLEGTGNDVPKATKSYLESEEIIGTALVGDSDPPKISDNDLLSVVSEPKISNLTAISHVSSGKKEDILSSAVVSCSSPGKTEVSASLSRAEQEVDNLVKTEDKPLLPTSSSVASNLVEAQISNGQIGQEITVNTSTSSKAKQKDIIEDACPPKCDKAREDSAKCCSSFHMQVTPGNLFAKQDHSDVVKHESHGRRQAHTKKLKRPLLRSQRTKSELPVSSKIQAENHYANKRQKLEGGQPRQVCNSKNFPPVKAVPTLTVPQEFHFHTEERFQTHRGASCQAFAQGGSAVSPYVSLAEKVLKFQFNDTDRFRSWTEQHPLKLTRPKEPDLVTSQRARPTRIKSSAEIEEEMIANMPKFKARPLNKKILEGPTLAALPRSTPQLPEFQEFNLKTSERAHLHANAPNNLASGSEIGLVSQSRKRSSSMMNSRSSAPFGPYVSTSLSNERSIETIEENGPWKRSKISACSSDKKLMPYIRQEEATHLAQGKLHLPVTSTQNVHSVVAQNNTDQHPKRAGEDVLASMGPQSNAQYVILKENMPHPFQFISGIATEHKPLRKQTLKVEAHSVLLGENSVVSEKTRKPLSDIQTSHAVQFGPKANNILPTHFPRKENVFSGEPSPTSVQDYTFSGQLKEPLQASGIQIKNGVHGRPANLTLHSGSIPRQIR